MSAQQDEVPLARAPRTGNSLLTETADDGSIIGDGSVPAARVEGVCAGTVSEGFSPP